MLVLGAGIGVVNGLATTVLRVPSFIVTLGMMLALAGIVDWRTGGAANQNPADDFREIGRGYVDDVPVVEVHPLPADHPAGDLGARSLADAPPVRPQPDRRR